jgi:hypothetical protein
LLAGGTIPKVRIGRAVRIDPADLEAAIQAMKAAPRQFFAAL